MNRSTRNTEVLPVGTKISTSQIDYNLNPKEFLIVKNICVTNEWNIYIKFTVSPDLKDKLRELYSGATHIITGVEVEHHLLTNEKYNISFFIDGIDIDELCHVINEENKFNSITRYYIVPVVEFRKYARYKHLKNDEEAGIVSIKRLENVFQGALQWQVFLVDNEFTSNKYYQYLQYLISSMDEINQESIKLIEQIILDHQEYEWENLIANLIHTVSQTKVKIQVYEELFEKTLKDILMSKVHESNVSGSLRNKLVLKEFDLQEYEELQKKWKKIILNNKPLSEDTISVLVVGLEGSGKSTIINSICNYIKYSTIEEAKTNVVNVIPTQFTMVNSNKTITFNTGTLNKQTNDQNVDTKTRFCRTYEIHHHNYVYKFIDTPGFTKDDNVTKKKIMKYIEMTPVDAILVVIKSYETSSPEYLKFIKSINDFYKRISKNMFICFTYSKINHYKGGESLATLLDHLKDVETNFMKQSSFYFFENEPYRYLNSFHEIDYSMEEFENLLLSWQKSRQETLRLFDALNHFSIMKT